MNFSKLYKVILENIIIQSKSSRAQMLAKVQNHQNIQNKLNSLAIQGKVENKAADFLAKFFKSGQLVDVNDKRIDKVVDILKRKTDFNIQTAIKLDQFLKQNQIYATREEKKKDESYLDRIPEFTQKKVYADGDVVVYRVDESRAGQLAMRKIIDTDIGQNDNPWCLLGGHGSTLEERYNEYWIGTYNAFPKHVAFYKGKLLAFCANSSGHCTWWDRNDVSSKELKLPDGRKIQTDQYFWTNQQLANMFIIKNGLVLNEKTGLYDSKNDVRVLDENITKDGKFPVKFGVINGKFDCYGCHHLKSLQGAPIKIKGGVNYDECTNMPGYKDYVKNKFVRQNGLHLNKQTGLYDSEGNVKVTEKYITKDGKLPVKFGIIDGNFDCSYCKNLTSNQGAPIKVTGRVNYDGCVNMPGYADYIKDRFIRQNKLILNKKTGRYDSSGNIRIKSDEISQGHFPIKFGIIEGNFECSNINIITSLEGGPEEVGGNFICFNNHSLTSLVGSPKRVGGNFSCQACNKLTSLEGASEWVGGTFFCCECDSLVSLNGLPKYIGGKLNCLNDTKLTDISAWDKKNVKGASIFEGCLKLPLYTQHSWFLNEQTGRYDVEGDVIIKNANIKKGKLPIKFGNVKGSFSCQGCTKLTSLQGAPTKTGSFNCSGCDSLTSLQGCTQEVHGNFDCSYCSSLTNLVGGPQIVQGCYNCNWCISLTSLQGMQTVGGNISLVNCFNLTNLKGIAQQFNNLDCNGCQNLQSLDGLPVNYDKQIVCTFCDKLKVGPKYKKVKITK